jgi:hypothetical protein
MRTNSSCDEDECRKKLSHAVGSCHIDRQTSTSIEDHVSDPRLAQALTKIVVHVLCHLLNDAAPESRRGGGAWLPVDCVTTVFV